MKNLVMKSTLVMAESCNRIDEAQNFAIERIKNTSAIGLGFREGWEWEAERYRGEIEDREETYEWTESMSTVTDQDMFKFFFFREN